jgi:hypothetical protein
MGYGRALAVMVITTFVLGAYFGGVVPALAPLFSAIQGNSAVQSSSVVGGGIIADIRFIAFVLGPLITLLAAVILAFVFAIRRELSTGVRP